MSVPSLRSLTLFALAAASAAEESTAVVADGRDAMPDVVVTAERRPSDKARASAVVEVVDASDEQERGYVLNPSDRLRRLPGLSVIGASGGIDGGIPSVTLRGTKSEHVAYLVDGIPVSDPSTTQATRNPAFLLPAGVERTEVVKGTQSGLYGSRAIGGVVNVRTADPTAEHQAEARATAGSFGTVGGELRASGPLTAGTGFAFAAEGLSSDGFSATAPRAADGDPDGYERDGVRRGGASLKLAHQLAERWRLTGGALGSAIDQEFDSSGPDDGGGLNRDRYGRLQTGLAFDGGSRGDAAVDVAYSRNRREYLDDTYGDTAYRSGEWYGQARGSLVAVDGLRVTAGGDGRRAWAESTGGVDAQETAGGIWGQAAWSTRWSEATLTGRQDGVSGFAPHTTGRAGLALLPVQALTVRAAVANGFRAPSLYERYVDVPAWSFTGNRDLEPETTRQGEVGVDLRPCDGLTLSGTVFRTLFDRRIAYQIDPLTWASTYVNEDANARSDGIETAATLDRPADLPFTARSWYTLTRTRDAQGQPFSNQPRHQLGSELTLRQQVGAWRFWQNLALERQFGYLAYGGAVRDRSLVSAAVGAEYGERYELSLRGENLLDERWSPGASDAANGYTSAPLAVFVTGVVRL